jgi:5-methyltetrahydropteroyltriglutamate--homocysteine methyltransferase
MSHEKTCFRISEEEYTKAIKEEISKVVKIQEELDIDVLVHGEPEVSILVSLVFQY